MPWCHSLIEESKNMSTKNPIVELKTNYGDIQIELNEEKAPETVANFLRYVDEGFYNHKIFHRVIAGFMVQGGGFTKDMEQPQAHAPIKNEAENGLKNVKGSIAMARTSDVNSASAQFFINLVDNSFLDFKAKNSREYGYCVFGKVISGMDVIEKIGGVKTTSKGIHSDVPVEAVEIIKAERV